MSQMGLTSWIVLSLVVFVLAVLYTMISSNVSKEKQVEVYAQQLAVKEAPFETCVAEAEAKYESWLRTLRTLYPNDLNRFYEARLFHDSELETDRNECYSRHR